MSEHKIIQLQTAAPIRGVKPWLFGLGDDGVVYVWYWDENKWMLLKDLE